MVRIGTDIVEISRFREMKDIERFKKHSFTKREVLYFESLSNPYESIAGAFAAKEAFSKYLGSGFRGFGLRDVEILHDEIGKPYIKFMGNRVRADISISHSREYATAVVCGDDVYVGGRIMDSFKSYQKLLPKRSVDANKGDCGRVFVVAGSVGMVGAAALCSQAAIRCGSGLVTLGTPECIQPYLSVKLTEVMTYPLECKNGLISSDALQKIKDKLEKSDVCAFGPGLGQSEDLAEVLEMVLKCSTPCVIDADGLNVLSANMDLLKDRNCDVILTPHPGEMSRLTGLSIDEIQSDRCKAAQELAKKYNVTVLLKGNNTVIAAPNGETHINETGNSGMASGGMGDVLTGVIASFVGQGLSPFDAALLGAYIHGLAGDIAADEVGELGLIASDVVGKLPFAIKLLQGHI